MPSVDSTRCGCVCAIFARPFG